MNAYLSSRYGEELGTWLTRRVAKLFRSTRDTYCVDNFRVCDTAIADEEREYKAAQAQGCCGFADQSVTHWASGRTFRFGFNFGH